MILIKCKELPPNVSCHSPADAHCIQWGIENSDQITCMSNVGNRSDILKLQISDDISGVDALEASGRIVYPREQFPIQEDKLNDGSLPKFLFDLVQEPAAKVSPYRNENPTQAPALDFCIPSRIRRSNDYFTALRKPGVWIEFPLSVESFLPCSIDDISLDDADRSIDKLTERLERLETHLDRNTREDSGALSSWKELRCVSELAYIYQKQNRLITAADLYYKLLDGYESLEAFEHHLSAQYLLARIQQRRGLHEKATEELIHAFSTCIRLKFIQGRRIKLGGRMSDIIAGLMVSNQRLRLANWDEVHFTLEKISGLLEAFILQEASDPNLNHDLPPTIIFLSARLANECTMLKDFESTTVLFSTIIQYLEHFNDAEYGTEKVCAYLKFALHLQRQGRWTQANSLLQIADERAINADPHDIDLSYCLRWCYAQLESKLAHERDPAIKETKILLARIKETAFSSVIKFSKGLHTSSCRSRDKESDGEEDFDMISEDQSYKYGVTFSRSVVTGVSNSIS
jgi:tetratricopeptide (TPR) repeat protein